MDTAETAFRRFFEEHHRELARLAFLLTGQGAVADDLAADALIDVRRRWDHIGAVRSPLASARGALVGFAGDWERRHRRSRRADLAAGDVSAALRRLPFPRRACVVLRYAFGLSELEVVDALGTSVAKVNRRTALGAARLTELLRETRLPPAPLLIRAGGGTPPSGRHRIEGL